MTVVNFQHGLTTSPTDSKDLELQASVEIAATVTAGCGIVETLGGGRYRVRTTVRSADEIVVDGEAVVLIEEATEE